MLRYTVAAVVSLAMPKQACLPGSDHPTCVQDDQHLIAQPATNIRHCWAAQIAMQHTMHMQSSSWVTVSSCSLPQRMHIHKKRHHTRRQQHLIYLRSKFLQAVMPCIACWGAMHSSNKPQNFKATRKQSLLAKSSLTQSNPVTLL